MVKHSPLWSKKQNRVLGVSLLTVSSDTYVHTLWNLFHQAMVGARGLPTTLKTGMTRTNSGIPTGELLQHAWNLCRTTEQYYIGKYHDLNSQICAYVDSHTACLMLLSSKLYLSCHKNAVPVQAATVPPAHVLSSCSKLWMQPLAWMATVPPLPALLGLAPCSHVGEIRSTNVPTHGFRGSNQSNCRYGL